MSLMEKLEAAREKAAQREFEVTITETLEMKVTVKAKDQLDAELIVNDAWDDGKYVLDAKNFTGVEFDAKVSGRELQRPNKGKEDEIR